MDIKVGDFVKGLPGADGYMYTTSRMTKGVVTGVSDNEIAVKILEHDDNATGVFKGLAPMYFEVIGHQKPFNRDEALELLKNGCKKALLDYDLTYANLRGADLTGADLTGADLKYANLTGADLKDADLTDANLRRADLTGADLKYANLRRADLRHADLKYADLKCADLRHADLKDADLKYADLKDADLKDADLKGANLDFSCLPLWCGGLKLKIDKRIACQLAYHLCTMQCEDAEYIAMRNSILGFANQFHRAEECGVLKPIEEVTDAKSNP